VPGITGGYLTSHRLKDVHWQPAGRTAPPPAATIAGESPLFVDSADIPATADVATLGRALAVLHPDYELMARGGEPQPPSFTNRRRVPPR
jgi:hypothetical protein